MKDGFLGTETFTWDNPPSLGQCAVFPKLKVAHAKAYYEHMKAGKPIPEFTFTYEYTAEDYK